MPLELLGGEVVVAVDEVLAVALEDPVVRVRLLVPAVARGELLSALGGEVVALLAGVVVVVAGLPLSAALPPTRLSPLAIAFVA